MNQKEIQGTVPSLGQSPSQVPWLPSALLTSIPTHQATFFLFHRPDRIHLIHILIHTEFPCWSLPYHSPNLLLAHQVGV